MASAICIFQCVQCYPGTSGWTHKASTCGINEYCDDDGYCQEIKGSPFFEQPCPYETGSFQDFDATMIEKLTEQRLVVGGDLSIWCGPGLRCYDHVCLICIPGMTDTDGAQTKNREYVSCWLSDLTAKVLQARCALEESGLTPNGRPPRKIQRRHS